MLHLILVAVVAALGVKCVFDFLAKRDAVRAFLGKLSLFASSVGLVEASTIFADASQGRLFDAIKDGEKLMGEWSDPKNFAADFAGVLDKVAGSVDGLKAMQAAVAKASAPKA